jgi:hypothetical protein
MRGYCGGQKQVELAAAAVESRPILRSPGMGFIEVAKLKFASRPQNRGRG